MSLSRLIKYARLAYFSQPSCDRLIYRTIRRHRPRRILEIGIGRGDRMRRMLELVALYSAGESIHYAGVDMFESRPAETPGLSFKDAHRMLTRFDVRGQLIPGDAYTALSRWANSLSSTDLVVISADQSDESLQAAWFYFPRMLTTEAMVLREVRPDGTQPATRFAVVSSTEIRRLAATREGRRAA